MSEHDEPERVAFRPFVGRIGGNQDFAVSKRTPGAKQILEKTPDAGYFLTWKESFDLNGFWNIELYKSALIEAWASDYSHLFHNYRPGPLFQPLLAELQP
ncbi:MAG: hypothetical protein Q9160_004842 [Pyrenula sp. 1 TL-2023]